MTRIETLAKQLTYDEYSIGKVLFSDMRNAGIASTKAAAMCYRAGRVDAKREERQRRKERHEAWLAQQENESPPEANAEDVPEMDSAQSAEPATEQEEGSTTDE